MKLKCKHILLSYDKAENSSHERPLGVAVEDAEKLIINQGTTTRFNALSSVDVATENGEPIISIFADSLRQTFRR